MKGVKKCIQSRKFYTILVVLFALLFTVSSVNNVSAISKDYSGFKLRLRYSSGSEYVLTDTLLYSDMVTQVKYLDGVRLEARNFGSVPNNTNYISVTGKINLVAQCAIDDSPDTSVLHDLYCPYNTGENPSLYAVAVNSTSSQWISDNINVYVTDWVKPVPDTSNFIHNRTFTYEYTFVITNNIPSTLDNLAFFFVYPGRLEGYNNRNYIYYFQGDANNKMLVDYTNDKNTAILQQQVQIQQLTLDAISNLNNSINSQSEQNAQDREDLQNQSDESSDAAADAGADISSGGQRLLDVITTFYGLFISPPQKDCKVSMGTLFNAYHSGSYADADLCSLSPPPAFSIIATLIMIGATIPFAVSVINTLIKIMEGVLTT